MFLETQYKIKNNPKYLNYLRTHSYWYKNLNRDTKSFDLFVKEIKEVDRQQSINKINNALNSFEMISTLMNTLK